MRRRKRKATWLPIVPTTFGEFSEGRTWFEGDLVLDTRAGGTTQVAFPLTLDQTPDVDTDQATMTLADFVQGQDYIMDRIVGMVNVSLKQGDEESSSVVTACACAAIAVLPVEPGDASETPSIPPQEWNPLLAQNMQQPWAFRRTWMLENSMQPNRAPFLYGYPTSNCTFNGGGAMTGPFVDVKVKRRIRKEERLFLIVAVGTNEVDGGEQNSILQYAYDLRVLGHMVRGNNKSHF